MVDAFDKCWFFNVDQLTKTFKGVDKLSNILELERLKNRKTKNLVQASMFDFSVTVTHLSYVNQMLRVVINIAT